MSTKSNSASSETPNSKASSTATSRAIKSSRGLVKSSPDSTPGAQNTRLAVDRSPASLGTKPTPDRRSPKIITPDKQAPRLKPSELQAELNLAQENLKKAKEKLVFIENEKAKTSEELKEAKRLTEEANEKLREALMAQKRAEEDSELEKFRNIEMEQAGIDAVQKKDEEWMKELEAVRTQHGTDVAALLSATEELHRVKEELSKACDAKNMALTCAEEAMKVAETRAKEVESLLAKNLVLTNEIDSKVETEAAENDKLVFGLKLEIDSLRKELERAVSFEGKLAEKEVCIEQLNVDLEATKMAESYARSLVEELKDRVEDLSDQADQARRLERSASESLESVTKQLEGSSASLNDAEFEIASLKEKIVLLEISIARHKGEREESEHLGKLAREETLKMVKKVESLMSDLESVRDEKTQALSNEQLAASSLQSLLEEKNKILNELEISRQEEEKSKKALESLASALHEVSSDARAANEKLLLLQVEHENHETQIKDLNLVLETTNHKYKSMIDDAKQEIDVLNNVIQQSERDMQKVMVEREQKELDLMNSVKKSEEECSSMENEVNRLVNLIKMTEEEACAMKEEEDRWKKSFQEAESEAISLKEVLNKTNVEMVELNKNLTEKENKLQSVLLENEALKSSKAVALQKVEELSQLLEEALAKKHGEKNNELTDSDKDYDMIPKVVEFSEQNGKVDMTPTMEVVQPQPREKPEKDEHNEVIEVVGDEYFQNGLDKDNMNEKCEEVAESGKNSSEPAQIDLKMWESCKIEAKDYSPEGENEQESFDDELESKAESNDGHDQINRTDMTENQDGDPSAPSKQQSNKKKKPLLQKFGNLLKKKSSPSKK